jgi:threonine/homoserine/homoserine lactone efflux protein
VRGGGLFSAYLSTLFLTLTNPMTILSFMAVFAGFGLGTSPDYLSASMLVGGVFVGSALWWLLLSSGVALFRSRVSVGWMRNINRLSGSVILAFGLYSLSIFLFR